MIAQSVKWSGDISGFLELIDQRKLPGRLVKLRCRSVEEVGNAIKTLAVRGAPAIGVCAAYGVVLSLQKLDRSCSLNRGLSVIRKACKHLASLRPTAVNLFRGLESVKRTGDNFAARNPAAGVRALQRAVLAEARAIYQEDVDMCRRIGRHGEKFIRRGSGVLTHCNAGAMATAGQGTALSVMFEAHRKGKKFKVYVDETRPLLQGARLTTWELKRAGIDVTLVCDSMAGWLMKQGKINAVITGADRIAANGDTANKIGTYSLAVLAHRHGIPFYVAAPSSTFDLSIKSGDKIPIEQRGPEEVTRFAKTRIAPAGIDVYNPAFDVTEAALITAIITEKGVIKKPDQGRICACLKSSAASK